MRPVDLLTVTLPRGPVVLEPEEERMLCRGALGSNNLQAGNYLVNGTGVVYDANAITVRYLLTTLCIVKLAIECVCSISDS